LKKFNQKVLENILKSYNFSYFLLVKIFYGLMNNHDNVFISTIKFKIYFLEILNNREKTTYVFPKGLSLFFIDWYQKNKSLLKQEKSHVKLKHYLDKENYNQLIISSNQFKIAIFSILINRSVTKMLENLHETSSYFLYFITEIFNRFLSI
jgi:hypothetical protein